MRRLMTHSTDTPSLFSFAAAGRKYSVFLYGNLTITTCTLPPASNCCYSTSTLPTEHAQHNTWLRLHFSILVCPHPDACKRSGVALSTEQRTPFRRASAACSLHVHTHRMTTGAQRLSQMLNRCTETLTLQTLKTMFPDASEDSIAKHSTS